MQCVDISFPEVLIFALTYSSTKQSSAGINMFSDIIRFCHKYKCQKIHNKVCIVDFLSNIWMS